MINKRLTMPFLIALGVLGQVAHSNGASARSSVSKEKNYNPILPGYYADPSACKFGDKYYIYATSDGFNVNQTSGRPCVWVSDDFANWFGKKLDLRNPDGSVYEDARSYFWAPTAFEHNNKYYIFFTMADYYTMVAEGDTPDGTFTVLGNLFGTSQQTRPYNKTIDAQVFKDSDNKVYIAYLLRENPDDGDKALYTAIAQLDPNDLTKVLHVEKIEELSYTYREGQEILKHDGKYYMLYSQGWWRDSSYHVKYAIADDIYGPYEEITTILSATEDGSIIGTGHHSVVKDGSRYFMVYHRQFNPFIGPGFRQVCVDEMHFARNGKIEPITPTEKGIGALKPSRAQSLVETAVVLSPSEDEYYKPEYLVDDSYGTLWKSKDDKFPSEVVIDMAYQYDISKTAIYFEFANKYYQYKVQISLDGKKWWDYADRSDNTVAASPMTDVRKAKARFIKLIFFGMEDMSDTYGVINSNPPTINRETPRVGIFELKIYGKNPKKTRGSSKVKL